MTRSAAARGAPARRSARRSCWPRSCGRERPTSAKAGDSALVLPDGTIDGFVGGTCAESTVRLQGLRLLETGESTLLRITPGRRTAARAEPARGVVTVANPCLSGGALEIFLEAMLPAAAGARLRRRARRPRAGSRRRGARLRGRGDDRPGRADPAGRRRPSWSPRTAATRSRCSRRRCAAGVAATSRWSPAAGAAPRCSPGSTLDRRAARPRPTRRPAWTSARGTARRSRCRSSPRSSPTRPRPPPPAAPPRRRPAAARPPRDDPVCGMAVAVAPTSLQLEHADRTWYFCGPGCRTAFADDSGAVRRWLTPTLPAVSGPGRRPVALLRRRAVTRRRTVALRRLAVPRLRQRCADHSRAAAADRSRAAEPRTRAAVRASGAAGARPGQDHPSDDQDARAPAAAGARPLRWVLYSSAASAAYSVRALAPPTCSCRYRCGSDVRTAAASLTSRVGLRPRCELLACRSSRSPG